ncbi:hypothetical protein ElyMa_003606500 [Elysia marginata]|uniref:Thioredoxin-like fold domain-containing protein n=1 Tax=Elysia marginata TaxID=1093978 RepID=A0AAV4ES64_9GAST|nr:hypothetical protein ElyMa_003606500 [Elysia marginata]
MDKNLDKNIDGALSSGAWVHYGVPQHRSPPFPLILIDEEGQRLQIFTGPTYHPGSEATQEEVRNITQQKFTQPGLTATSETLLSNSHQNLPQPGQPTYCITT